MAIARAQFTPVHAIPSDWTVVKTERLTAARWARMTQWLSSDSAHGRFAVFPARMLRVATENDALRGATAWGFSDPTMAVEFKMRFG